MTTRFKLWRDGLLITAALAAMGIYWATKVGLESGWILESQDGAPVPAGSTDLQLRERGRRNDLAFRTAVTHGGGSRLILRTACNAYDGRYVRRLHHIRIASLSPAWTCAAVDGPLLDTFRRAERYTLRDERLTLTTPDGHALVFRRATWPFGSAPRRRYERPAV
jgi:hypothetical protein